MNTFNSVASYCLASLLTLLILSEVCWTGVSSAPAGVAGDEGYKRGWRPQGRFGKRTLVDHRQRAEDEMAEEDADGGLYRTDSILPNTDREDYLLNQRQALLNSMAEEEMEEPISHNNIGLHLETKSLLWADGTVCIQRGAIGMYKCYRWRQTRSQGN